MYFCFSLVVLLLIRRGLNSINRIMKKIIKNFPDCDKYERDSCYTLEKGEWVKDYLEGTNGDCRDYIYLESDKKENTHVTWCVTCWVALLHNLMYWNYYLLKLLFITGLGNIQERLIKNILFLYLSFIDVMQFTDLTLCWIE